MTSDAGPEDGFMDLWQRSFAFRLATVLACIFIGWYLNLIYPPSGTVLIVIGALFFVIPWLIRKYGKH